MKVVIAEPFGDGAMLQIGHMLANALVNRGNDVRLMASQGTEIERLERVYSLDDTFRFDRNDRQLAGAITRVARLRWLVRRFALATRFIAQFGRAMIRIARQRPNILVVSTVFRYPLIGLLLRIPQLRGVALVQLCHEFELREESPTLPDRILHRLNDRVYRHFDRIILLSRYQRDRFVESHPFVNKNVVALVPLANGAIFEELRRDGSVGSYLARLEVEPESAGYILFFGRIRPDKGVEDLVDAYRQMAFEHGPSAPLPPLLLCGHARENFYAQIVERAAGIDRGKVVVGGNYVPGDAVWDLVSRARVVVLPYRSASQSAALQVAMTCGVPIVATKVGGIPEVVENGRNGRLVPPGDPAALADVIATALSHPQGASEWATAAAQDARTTYAWDRFAARFEHVVRPTLVQRS